MASSHEMSRLLVALAALVAAACLVSVRAAGAQSLVLTQRVQLPAVDGRIDHMDIVSFQALDLTGRLTAMGRVRPRGSLLSSGSSTPYRCPPAQEPALADAARRRCRLRQAMRGIPCNISLDRCCHARPSLKCDVARDAVRRCLVILMRARRRVDERMARILDASNIDPARKKALHLCKALIL